VDGNKRTAIVTAVTFLAINGYMLTADDGMLYSFTMGIASGEIDESGAAAFFRDHSVALEV
jgi:death-on-curing protein